MIQILKSQMHSLVKMMCLKNTSMISGLCQFSFLPFCLFIITLLPLDRRNLWQVVLFKNDANNISSPSDSSRTLPLPHQDIELCPCPLNSSRPFWLPKEVWWKLTYFHHRWSVVLEMSYVGPCGDIQNSDVLSSREIEGWQFLFIGLAFFVSWLFKKSFFLWVNHVKAKRAWT